MAKGIFKNIIYFGQRVVLCCDAKCGKAWGRNSRPTNKLSDEDDDYEYLADGELEMAPADPGTYEGFEAKPPYHQRLNKWCARECERSEILDPGEPMEVKNLSVRFPNVRPEDGWPQIALEDPEEIPNE